MNELTHVIERKNFVHDEELKKKYEDGELESLKENNFQIHNILRREDFVKDDDLRNRYSMSETNLPILESPQKVKLLDKNEKLLGFDEFVNRYYKT